MTEKFDCLTCARRHTAVMNAHDDLAGLTRALIREEGRRGFIAAERKAMLGPARANLAEQQEAERDHHRIDHGGMSWRS